MTPGLLRLGNRTAVVPVVDTQGINAAVGVITLVLLRHHQQFYDLNVGILWVSALTMERTERTERFNTAIYIQYATFELHRL